MSSVNMDTISSHPPQENGKMILPGLGVVNKLVEKLNTEDISYCHWKSNEHVQEGMLGITDLDILVDRRVAQDLNRILSETGFKRFAATPLRSYPAVEDYLGLDAETGRLIHLHLHYQLTIGEKHLKGYRLPWELLILSNRKSGSSKDIYVADPDVETVLLIVRAALKIRIRDRFLWWLKKTYLDDDFMRELYWLREKLNRERVTEIATDLLGEEAACLLNHMISTQPSFQNLVALRKSIKPALRLYKTYGRLEAAWRGWFRELHWLFGAVNKRYLHMTTPTSRTVPNGGLMIAVLGVDGSGKSTIVKAIVKWLAWKVDVVPIYLGSGDGPSSLYRLPLKLAFKLLRKVTALKSKYQSATGSTGNGRLSFLQRRDQRFRGLTKVPWALVLSYEKRIKLYKASRARNRGMIVICDRFPQSQVMGFNDGPLLSHWLDHRLRIFRAVARWEGAPYQWSTSYAPDLVIKLQVTPQVAMGRKQDMGMEKICKRIEAVKNLQYPPATKVVEVDTDQPLEQVMLKIKQLVWQAI